MTPAGMETVDRKWKDHSLVAVAGDKTDNEGFHHFFTQRRQVDPKKNLFVAGTPELAKAKPETRDGKMYIRFENNEVNVSENEEDNPDRHIKVQVWEYRGVAVEEPELSGLLSDKLHRHVRVARTIGPWDRKARQNFVKNDNPLRAQDGYPVHPIVYEDVEAIYRELEQPFDASRFRYQLMLKGLPFRAIHNYASCMINGVEATQPKPSGRCEVTGFDQNEGGISSIKPMAAIARLAGRWVRPDEQKDHVMGENWLPKGETIITNGNVVVFEVLRDPRLNFEELKK